MEQKFEHAALEQDIQRLSTEIKERQLQTKGKEGLRAVLQEQIPASPKQAGQLAPAATDQPSSLPQYIQQESADVQLKVEKLLDMAWHKGVAKTFKEARKSGQLILDAFHDALTDKLYDEFKKRGLL